MALRRTVDLLPEIFRTDTNQKFLAATLDQLTQEPNVIRTQGFIGRKTGPGVDPSSNYVTEPTTVRTDYQLEPGVMFLKPGTSQVEDTITYPGMIDALALQGANVTRQDRLWESEYYAWDPFCDLDKFCNYSQYYWLPTGPDSVDVSSTVIPLTDDFTVTRNSLDYTFSGIPGNNPIITLARGGNYTFIVNQSTHNFWIQSTPGVSGRLPQTPNISSRDVFGVINNGEDVGTIEFYVPTKSAQDFYYSLPQVAAVDFVTSLKFNEINDVSLVDFLAANPTGIDGITSLNGRTVVFSNTITDAAAGGWQIGNTDITLQSQRYSVWLITYVDDGSGNITLQLSSIRQIANLTKFRILYGDVYSSTDWYKDASGYLEQVPLLTAAQDVLYYQDSSNPEIVGEIRLVDYGTTQDLDINDIIGAKNYTSPNGVVFTNGLKVQFRGVVYPAQYQDIEYYVEGVGTGPGLDLRVGFINGEAYFGAYHVYQGQKMTGVAHSTTVFQQYIYDTIEESLLNPGAGGPAGSALPQDPVSGANLSNGIKLIPVTAMITPETYTKSEQSPYDFAPYDSTSFDATLNAPLVPDYITINRSGADRNAWTRSNRWFHIDVINYSAQLNNVPVVVDNAQRGRRPIIEFRGNLKLWDSGTEAKSPVNIIDFNETDALSNINGQTGYGVDGYQFLDGSRVIFAADLDPQVRNRIYTVRFIDPANDGNFVIDLEPALNGIPLINETVVSLNGLTQQGVTHWFDGADWITAQQKSGVNQPPLFDIYDQSGRSFGDRVIYPSSTFTGNRLFGYADGATSAIDAELGLSLKFLNINNIGDIVFQNYFYTDSFIYVENNVSSTVNLSTGFVRQYIDRVSFTNELGWQPAAELSRSRQVFNFTANGSSITLDVPVDLDSLYPPVQIFVQGVYIDPLTYTIDIVGTTTVITFGTQPVAGSIIEVQALSNQASGVAFYQIPLNLETNPFNGNSSDYTLGGIRNHYESIGQNLRNLVGIIDGQNNTRDLGNILPYGTQIVQNSSALTLPGVFLRRPQYNIFNSLTFNSQEYEKYKALLMDLASRGDYVNLTPTQVLDTITQDISITRTEMTPFYWSDMLPAGDTYRELTYTVTPISTSTFDTTQIFDLTQSNFQAVLVYLNGTILTLNQDYTVPAGTATVVISSTLATGDVVTIREYDATYGSFVPNTPTKMGLYPSYVPAIYIDESYVEPTLVIRGHDGSITIAFGDFRDDVLLEFETRIFNNLKIHSTIPLTQADIIPGQFRTTDYTLEEITNMLLPSFLSWVGWNKLDYTTQTYIASDAFTYNYSQSSNRLNKEPLLGAWRGIYNYFYDTLTPNTTPWEMLGFSQEPSWWQEQYGPAPYTSGNLVLWQDLEAGFIADPNNPRIDTRYSRPGLTEVIPSDSEGALLSPLQAVVGNYDTLTFRQSWTFGDDGPVESAWRTSSSWPFAVMRLMALTKPAEFFNLFVDRDRYVYNDALEQYLWDDRYRLVPSNIAPLYGNGQSRASYVNWIIDYNRQRGLDSSATLAEEFNSLDVRLAWRMGGFSDKNYLKVYTERSTPSGTNTNLLLPDESYQLLLYQNVPFAQAVYSSVIVQVTDTGWAVSGYNTLDNYFEILVSIPQGQTVLIEAGGSAERVSVEYTNTIVRIPYGYVFTNRSALCDFLCSYGELLTQRGFNFEGTENGYIMNWRQMAQEFLYWSNQGWTAGSIINLNPGATKISVTQPGAVVESLYPARLDNLVLDQNQQVILPSDLLIDRLGNKFSITTISASTINFLRLQFTAYENVMVVDNRSLFADLLYDPLTGNRQSRLLISGWLSGDWDGTVNAPGFVSNQDTIQEWQPNIQYSKGQIVLFKNEYWSASSVILPSTQFDYSLWLKSDYAQIQQGLLPNAANASDQLARAYSVYSANLESEVDLFSYGLIGFRPRQYMQALNLGDVSQVQLYQQFIGSKGTIKSAEIFSFADLGKEVAQYDIYEYWAMLRSTYGANANRSYFELRLNEALLPSDPALIQVIQPQELSQADQTVFVSDIWKSSYKITSPNILPTTTVYPSELGLPSAGYVDLDDVDITVFDLNDPTIAGPDSAALQSSVPSIGIGTTIWVARVNTYNWGVYAVEKVPATIVLVENNLDGNSLVTFNGAHGLSVGDTLIIKYFDATINGSYVVLSIPSINSLLIPYQFTGLQTSISGTGLGLFLQTARVQQLSDISLLPYANDLLPGARVWVDNNGDDLWTVVEKTQPFTPKLDLVATVPVAQSYFGSAVAQGLFNLSAMIGAPGYNPSGAPTPPGAVYTFVKTDQNIYVQNSLLTLSTTDAAGYGNAMDIGKQTWGVVGASASANNQGYVTTIYVAQGSNLFEQRQLLVTPDQDFNGGEFGYAVVISLNDQWMYISAPDHNKVFAYTQVKVQTQAVSYITDGATVTYNWSNSIDIDYIQPNQLAVVLDNVLLSYPTDYAVTPTNITLTSAPLANRELIISRVQTKQLDQKLTTGVTATGGSGSDATFVVNNIRGDYTVDIESGGVGYVIGNTLTVLGSTIETPDAPASDPANNLTITVTDVDLDGVIIDISISGTGVTNTSTFPLDKYLATATNLYSFTVRVNDVLQRPHIDYDFAGDVDSTDSYDLVFETIPPAGAVILVSSENYFEFVDELPTSGLGLVGGERFGHSIACDEDGSQVMVGCPNKNNNAGTTYVYARNMQRFIVNDATQTEYRTVQDLAVPGAVSVTLNNELLLPNTLNIGGQFSVDTTNPADQFVNITESLNVGDVIEISTNQFSLIETVVSASPAANNKFGYKLDVCPVDYGLYISSPFESSVLDDAGKVELYQNQTTLYGTITGNVANPTVTPGDYLRINNTFVEVIGTTVEELVADITAAAVPNITAGLTTDLVLEGDGVTKIFDVGTIYSATTSYTPVVYVNNVLLTSGLDYTYNNTTQQISFVVAPNNTAPIRVVSGRIVISVTNFAATTPQRRLSVLPGQGTVFDDIGLDIYVHQQTIQSPVPQAYAQFGEGLFISEDATTLIVGAPNGNMIRACTFDGGTTYFDSTSTKFADTTIQSGAVYSYDLLPSTSPSITNPAQFVFGQQFTNDELVGLDKFGASVDYTTGVLLIGTPGSDLGDSSVNYGRVVQFENTQRIPAWTPIRLQEPAVDINLLDNMFIYDLSTNNTRTYLDYFNPLQGKLLGAVRQNLDYIGAVDPAEYTNGAVNNYGSLWAQEKVGNIWWDTNNARFIDPNQDDIVYASRRWGQLFPGSSVDVYQWIVSDVPPADYVGAGTVRSTTSYVTTTSLTQQGFITIQYYYWVTGLTDVYTTSGKTLSISTLAQYIDNPRSSGIPYMAPINASTVAIYNSLPYINAQLSVLHVEYDREATDAAVHVEYQLIPQGRADGFLTDNLYRKMLDSLTGSDTAGNAVPDPFLSPSEYYGVQYRPRQSMVANRFLALKNYLGQANTVMAQYPIAETRRFTLLNSADPEPTQASGAWDKRVLDLEELSYQDISAVPLGYRYLVVSDSSNNGLWTIYQVIAGQLLGSRTFSLLRVQTYDTRKYWSYIDWYLPTYNKFTRILLEVPTRSSLDTLTVSNNTSVKVTANSRGKWEIYQYNNGVWTRVGLQDGTVEFSNVLWDYTIGRFGFDSEVFDAQYFDQAPITETRKILEAVNQEIMVDDLLIERNNLLMLFFNFIMSEQIAPDWLTKTSLIDVDHTIRDLLPYQIYRTDNQDFVLDYINEVKPYHVQIREFNLRYQGLDTYQGDLTDFDLPAYYDPLQQLFISPVLDNVGNLSTTSSVPSTSTVWQTFPYNQWFNNYTLSIDSVVIVSGGSGYVSPPEIIVTGDAVREAQMISRINSAGTVVEIIVLDPGVGYLTTATISFVSESGSGASAVAIMGNGLVRNINTTIKYDRYQYTSTIFEWVSGVSYVVGDQVRYDNIVWEAVENTQSTTFDPAQWATVPASSLSGVDRTMGFYTPTANQPGLDLAQLISGIDYPGVQVQAPTFDQNTGFDVGNYDINPFDNISYGPNGEPTYDPAILDAAFSSSFLDPFLGTRATDINISGGAFVDAYESHAPEELVPGITYDTLDMRVYTTPGADWVGQGFGFPTTSRNFVYTSISTEASFANELPYPVQVRVFNQTEGVELSELIDYSVDWANFVVDITSVQTDGDVMAVVLYSLGGGNQVYTNSYIGTDFVDNAVIIPYPYALITDFAIFANGVQVDGSDSSTSGIITYTASAEGTGYTLIQFSGEYTAADRITITALGNFTNTGWSVPLTQYIVSDGSLVYTLTNSMQGTNPANIIVNKNGTRARPSQGIAHIGDGTTVIFELPLNGGYSQGLIANNDVSVYVDNQAKTLGVDFFVDAYDGSSNRTITFTVAPDAGSNILISVRTIAQYWVVGNQIIFQPTQGLVPVVGDIISVTSFNDTQEQLLETQIFVGPTTSGTIVAEGYDDTLYDEASVYDTPGSYDYSTGVQIVSNTFDIGIVRSASRLVVTLDGRYLFHGVDFEVAGTIVTILGAPINAAQVVVITSYTEHVVPSAMAFRIFQDMRGVQSTYRITPATTTVLAQSVTATADVIYVVDANNLSEPDLPYGMFGLVTINGERIAYRNRDTVLNTISGLRRGTAGTGASAHAAGSQAYDIGTVNLLSSQYQDRNVVQNFLGDGATTQFIATDISVVDVTSTELVEAVQVYVGGILQTSGYEITSGAPVGVLFDQAPNSGYQVTVLVRRGESWYQPGFNTPSDGVPLQETNTAAARFLRGE